MANKRISAEVAIFIKVVVFFLPKISLFESFSGWNDCLTRIGLFHLICGALFVWNCFKEFVD